MDQMNEIEQQEYNEYRDNCTIDNYTDDSVSDRELYGFDGQ